MSEYTSEEIEAIRKYREQLGLGLLEAKEKYRQEADSEEAKRLIEMMETSICRAQDDVVQEALVFLLKKYVKDT